MATEVKFYTHLEELLDTAPPLPAHKFWPEWFKRQPPVLSDADDDSPTSSTIRKCPAALDILSMGYIIPLWCDFKLLRNEDQLGWMFPPRAAQHFGGIQLHADAQMSEYPFDKDSFKGSVKFINPWSIVTPKGYSCMLVNPYFHTHPNLRTMNGIVETDGYHEAHVNTFFTAPVNTEITLPKGMPLVQVIPFKREDYKMKLVVGNFASKLNKVKEFLADSLFNGDRNRYRSELYVKRYK